MTERCRIEDHGRTWKTSVFLTPLEPFCTSAAARILLNVDVLVALVILIDWSCIYLSLLIVVTVDI